MTSLPSSTLLDVVGADRPGLDPQRLIRLMEAAIDRCHLDLTGYTVLTEAASGAYVITPVLAAMAGAHVIALAAGTSYATGDDLHVATAELARLAGVAKHLQLISEKTADVAGVADIVTNSGQVRPIDAAMVDWLKPTAVIPLMYESWEYRPSDVDLDACRARRIQVAGTDEAHAYVESLAYVGVMAVKQLHDAGVAVYRSRIVLVCNNSFATIIAGSLRGAGAEVVQAPNLTADLLDAPCDAVLLAMTPASDPVLGPAEARLLHRAAGTILVQYWGDVDRAAIAAAGVPVWPQAPPRPGHMGVLPSAVGPEPVVRLQAGGLKVGELLARGITNARPDERGLVQML
jgi:hypothetical protein